MKKLSKWQKRALKHGILTIADWDLLKEQVRIAGEAMAANAAEYGGIEAVNRVIMKELKRLNRRRFGRIPKEEKPKRRQLEMKLKDLD